MPMPGGSCFGHLLDLAHGLAGAVAGRGLAEDGDGRRAVEALELRRAERPLRGGEGRERHHAALRVAHVPAVQVLGQHAEGRVALHVDLFHAALVDEVVDVGGAQDGAQRGVDVGERKAQRAGFFLVDVDLILGRVLEAVGAHRGEHGILHGHAEQLVARGHERVVAEAGAIHQPQVEAGRGAQFEHRRRREGEREGVLDLHELAPSRGPGSPSPSARAGCAPPSP